MDKIQRSGKRPTTRFPTSWGERTGEQHWWTDSMVDQVNIRDPVIPGSLVFLLLSVLDVIVQGDFPLGTTETASGGVLFKGHIK